jgi:hypothetical protein
MFDFRKKNRFKKKREKLRQTPLSLLSLATSRENHLSGTFWHHNMSPVLFRATTYFINIKSNYISKQTWKPTRQTKRKTVS